MKKIFKALLGLILLLTIFILYTFYTTGFFRGIEYKFEGEILAKVPIVGADFNTFLSSRNFYDKN